MSAVQSWSDLRERAAGKWQIPLLLLSLALLGAAVFRTRPRELRLPVEQLIAEVETLSTSGLHAAAIEQAQRLLSLKGLSDGQRSELRLLAARAQYLDADQHEEVDRTVWESVVAAFDQALRAGAELSLDDYRRRGEAALRCDRTAAAVQDFERVIAASLDPELDLRRRVAELKLRSGDMPPAQVESALKILIDNSADRPDLLYWAVERMNDLWLETGRTDDAQALIERVRAPLESSEQAAAWRCEEARVLWRAARTSEAETRLRALQRELSISDPVYARAGWLLGRIVLDDEGPPRDEEALSFFREVAELHAPEPYRTASNLGMADALTRLGRVGEALPHYQSVAKLLRATDAPVRTPNGENGRGGPEPAGLALVGVSADQLRASLTVVAQQLAQHAVDAQTLAYAELAASLVDSEDEQLRSIYLTRLGEMRTALARSLLRQRAQTSAEDRDERERLADEARSMFMDAARAFVQLSRSQQLNEEQAVAAIWRAVDLLDESGDREQTVATLDEFVAQRPNDPLVPRALLRLGQLNQAVGRYHEAIDAYERNLRWSDTTPYALASLVPLATCYIALGSDYDSQAEEILHRVLNESPALTPQAPEFADALFLRGDLLTRRGEYDRAIPVLEEALQRYPNDRRRLRAEFLLADSYRQSALAIKQERLGGAGDPEVGASATSAPAVSSMGEAGHMREQQEQRLLRSADIFGALVDRFEDVEDRELDDLQRTLLRHARFYQADCLFETQRFAEALALYERVAWIYRDVPACLAAYTQIINCNVSLGAVEEARAALRRAQYVVRSIPEEQFARSVSPETREDWERFFNWLERSDLF